MIKKKSNLFEVLGITLKLLVICSIVATIVATVNYITKDKIAFNEKQNTANALSDIYKDEFDSGFSVSGNDFIIEDNDKILLTCTQENSVFYSKDIKALYVLKDSDSNIHSYCISVQPMGFKDYIKMLVAITPECTVKGVKIVSMSETSGIGTKVQDASFLNKFKNLNDTEVMREVDVISGATKTSKPVIDAVAASLRAVSEYTNSTGGIN